jgi:hypothetical protein
MTTTTHQRVPSTPVLAWTAGIAAVWLTAAFLRADTTLHLGPLLLPLVPAILGRDAEHPIRLTMIGVGAGAATIVVLFASGNLDGPALEPFNRALTESLVLLGVGSVVGLIIAALSGRRSL